MQISIVHSIKIGKTKNPGEVLSLVFKWLKKHEYISVNISFELADSENSTISPTSRIINKYKDMEKYLVKEINAKDKEVLSLVGLNQQISTSSNDIDNIERLIEICGGVPRKYPFIRLHLALNDIKWGYEDGNPSKLDATVRDIEKPRGSKVIIISDWWISGRDNALHMVIPISNKAITQNEIYFDEREILVFGNEIGEKHIRKYCIEYDDEEKKAYELVSKKLMDQIKKCENEIEGICSLSKYSSVIKTINLDNTHNNNISVKNEIKTILLPLGYEYISEESGLGVYVLRKKTENNNRIDLVIDLTPMGHKISCMVKILSINGKVLFSINLPYQDGARQCPLTNQCEVNAAISIYGEVLVYFENKYLPNLDLIAGISPKWF